MNAAVLLDRDGVLVEDIHLLRARQDVHILPGVPQALKTLSQAGFRLFVASNQTVVSRGLATEAETESLNNHINELLAAAGGARIEKFYVCFHHPQATLARYRAACQCRKPHPGLLQSAAREQGLDLRASFMVGDRITDVIAGVRAGCRTVLVQTGKHLEPPIKTAEPVDISVKPDHVCADLPSAATWILNAR